VKGGRPGPPPKRGAARPPARGGGPHGRMDRGGTYFTEVKFQSQVVLVPFCTPRMFGEMAIDW
jgi:hypothetical protein